MQLDRLTDRRRRRRVAELEREHRDGPDQRAVGVQVDLLHVAALVVRGHVDLDRIGRRRREVLGGPLEADDRRRRGVGRGRQQVVEAALEQLAARRRRSTCSRPKPNVTVSRVEMIAPPVAFCDRGGRSRPGSLLAQRLVVCRRAQLRRRSARLGCGSGVPSAFWFGSFVGRSSIAIGRHALEQAAGLGRHREAGDRRVGVVGRGACDADAGLAADDAEVVLPRVVRRRARAQERGAGAGRRRRRCCPGS